MEFVDILEPRRRQNDAFNFMSRYWSPQKAYVAPHAHSPQELKDVVAKSLYMETIIEAESARTGADKEQLRKEVLQFLEEMGLDRKMYVVRSLGIFFIKTVLMMKTGVFVNERRVFQLKGEMGRNPVIFLPTHRSYADFCLMTYLCFHYDIELPAVAAGMDFYSMAVLGRVMRDTSAFYMRRTLAGAPLYAASLRRYVGAVLAHNAAPTEFFLEGTRSRANKSLAPKYGLISMALLPLFTREVSDVTIVPVNISYDRLVEQTLFSYEHLGVPKPKESTGALIKAMNVLNDHYGNVYINIGVPFSVKEYLNNDLRQTDELLQPVDLQQLTPEQFALVQSLADDVVTMQQKCTIVTIFNLIALVLMHSLVENTPLSVDLLYKDIEWLARMLRGVGAEVFDGEVEASVAKVLLVHRATVKLDGTGNLRLISSPPVMMSSETEKKMKGHILKAESMVSAVPVIQLQLYVNPVLHCLVPPALLCVAVGGQTATKEQLFATYNSLRCLLKYEFFYTDKFELETRERALSFCVENDALCAAGEAAEAAAGETGFRAGGNGRLLAMLRSAVWPALTSLDKSAQIMTEMESCEHWDALRLVQRSVEQSSGCHPYSLSLEANANCLRGLLLYGALTQTKQDTKTVYSVVRPRMAEARRLINATLPRIHARFDSSNVVILDQGGSLSRL